MKLLPITIAGPTIAPLVGGRVKRLRITPNARGELAEVDVGDLLWIREPFAFQAKWDDHTPTRAIEAGAVVHFTGTLARGGPAMLGLGKARGAQNLPLIGHRYHLQVIAVSIEPLQRTPEKDMRDEGYASRNAWVDAWDRSVSKYGPGLTWSDNPDIPVIAIELHKRPAPTDG